MSVSNTNNLSPVAVYLGAAQLSCDTKHTTLRHHKAGLFLQCLIHSAKENRTLTKPEFLNAWALIDPHVSPDRTALRRITAAVGKALASVLPEGDKRLEFRHATTGPWRLMVLPHESWHIDVEASAAAGLKAEPSFTQNMEPLSWYAAASALAIADSHLADGDYALTINTLQSQMQELPLCDAAWCLWMLRLIKVQRRLGLTEQALEGLQQMQGRMAGLTPRLRVYMQCRAALTQAKLNFDQAPQKASLTMDFEKIRTVMDTAPNAALQWEWCNLRAMALRRQIEQHLAAKAQPHLVQNLANEAVQTYGAAYFWACLAEDPYHCQAIACNFANNLFWLDKQGLLEGGLAGSMAWFRLAHTLVAWFHLPQDSPWDYLMLGNIYQTCAKARAAIAADPLSWPAGTNPATESFYAKGLGLARSHGTPRQLIVALNQLAGHFSMVKNNHADNRCSLKEARAERDALLALHGAVAKDLVRDGFEVL